MLLTFWFIIMSFFSKEIDDILNSEAQEVSKINEIQKELEGLEPLNMPPLISNWSSNKFAGLPQLSPLAGDQRQPQYQPAVNMGQQQYQEQQQQQSSTQPFNQLLQQQQSNPMQLQQRQQQLQQDQQHHQQQHQHQQQQYQQAMQTNNFRNVENTPLF